LPTIILKGQLVDAAINIDTASQLIAPLHLDQLAISARKSMLRRNRAERITDNIGPFVHGQSISLMGAEMKGSVSVFLSSEDESEDQAYALTAYHVVPFIPVKENRFITPGGLDILTRLLKIGSKATHQGEVKFLLDRWNSACGEVRYGHIGTNGNSWRSDWALVCLENPWKGSNGSWMHNEMTDFTWRQAQKRLLV
jgi:hypothetical protein